MAHNRKISKEDQSWQNIGVDIRLIRDNLELSCEERIAQHQNTLDFIDELKQAGQKICAKSSSPSKAAHSQPR